ncbi:hypothetical protein VPH35_116949 [Triticum aestivum]
MYVDRLDLSTVDFTGIGGPPPPQKFVVSAWTYDAVKAKLAADKITDTKYGKLQLMAKHAIDYNVFGGPQNFGKWMDVHSAPSCPVEARAPVEHLIGHFASGMTSLLGKLVEGWTSLNGSDSDAVARHFTPFVAERTHRPTGCRGRYDYNSSQELPDTPDELDGDAALDKDDDDDMENGHHDTNDDEHVEVRAGGKKGKGAPDVPSPEKVKEHTAARGKGVSPSKRGRDPEDVGQGSPVKRPRTDPLAAGRSEATAGGRAVTKKQAPTPTRVSARLNTGAPIAGDTPSTRSSPRTSTSNTGDPVVLPDLRKTVKKVKKTTTRVTKQNPRDPLERMHSKPSIGGSSDVHEAPVDKPAAAASTVPTSSDASGRASPPVADVQATTAGIHTSGSDESVSARTAEILPTLLAMKDAAVSHATQSASVEVDAPEINLSKEDSRSSDMDSKRVGGGTSSSMKEGVEATVHNDMPSIGETLGTTAPASDAPEVAKVTVARAGLPPRRRSPRKQSADIPNALAVARSSRDDSGYVPASTLFPPPARSNVMERTKDRSTTDPGGKPGTTDEATPEEITPSLDEAYRRIEESALQRRSSRGQGQSSSNAPAESVSEDTIRSVTTGSVRQRRVVHVPPADDYEPEVKATKDQNQLYDIVKRFGNARSNSNHMKELKAHDCGFHMLEYLAKWEGRRVPVITAGMVVELRKIYTWNWLMNEDFNTRSNAREFIEEAVKKATKKYK